MLSEMKRNNSIFLITVSPDATRLVHKEIMLKIHKTDRYFCTVHPSTVWPPYGTLQLKKEERDAKVIFSVLVFLWTSKTGHQLPNVVISDCG